MIQTQLHFIIVRMRRPCFFEQLCYGQRLSAVNQLDYRNSSRRGLLDHQRMHSLLLEQAVGAVGGHSDWTAPHGRKIKREQYFLEIGVICDCWQHFVEVFGQLNQLTGPDTTSNLCEC